MECLTAVLENPSAGTLHVAPLNPDGKGFQDNHVSEKKIENPQAVYANKHV